VIQGSMLNPSCLPVSCLRRRSRYYDEHSAFTAPLRQVCLKRCGFYEHSGVYDSYESYESMTQSSESMSRSRIILDRRIFNFHIFPHGNYTRDVVVLDTPCQKMHGHEKDFDLKFLNCPVFAVLEINHERTARLFLPHCAAMSLHGKYIRDVLFLKRSRKRPSPTFSGHRKGGWINLQFFGQKWSKIWTSARHFTWPA
jgi:hypothetical protein